MDIGRAIERACAELPEGVEISISLEHHAGTVTLIDSNGVVISKTGDFLI